MVDANPVALGFVLVSHQVTQRLLVYFTLRVVSVEVARLRGHQNSADVVTNLLLKLGTSGN